MAKIYTRNGDFGDTSLGCGSRIAKDDLRVDAYGTIDELSSVLGVVHALIPKFLTAGQDIQQEQQFLEWLQEKLFTLASMLATANLPASNMPQILEQDVHFLEEAIDQMEQTLPDLQHFILPGGNEWASFIHLARTVCRRAERVCTSLDRVSKLTKTVLPFLNRLSDYLFVYGRWATYQCGETEKVWLGRKQPLNKKRVLNYVELADRLSGELGQTKLPLFDDHDPSAEEA